MKKALKKLTNILPNWYLKWNFIIDFTLVLIGLVILITYSIFTIKNGGM